MLDYNTIFFAECQDGNEFLFHFINFAQTQVIFYSKSTSKNIPFCFICAVVFNRDHCGESCAPSRNSSPSQKRSRIAALYTKKPPRTPPQWEKSSAVFAYQVYCVLRTSFCTAFYPHQRYFRRGGTKIFRLISFAIKGCYFATAPKSAFS